MTAIQRRQRRATPSLPIIAAALAVASALATPALARVRRHRTMPAGPGPGTLVYPFAPSPLLRAPRRTDGLRPFWEDGLPCSVGCRAPAAIPGWPLVPFHRQHALRAGLNELRDSSLHYGVDIQSRDRVAVYAIQPGRVHVIAPAGPDERLQVGNFIYWHLRIAVTEGQAIAPYRTILGRTLPGFGHLHLSEVDAAGRYLNPLRPSGRMLVPWHDSASPVIGAPRISRDGRAHVGAFDPQSFRVRTRYLTPVLAVAALGYRVFDARGHARGPLEMAYDGSQSLPWALHEKIFEPDSHRPGFACFATRLICKPVWDMKLAGGLAPRIDPGALGAGRYRLSIYAWDWAGNASARDQPFSVRGAEVIEGPVSRGELVGRPGPLLVAPGEGAN